MIELDNWRVFVTVAENGSITRAARALQLSVPTVSKRIAALEQQIGTPLFNRTSRRIALTAAGEYVLTGVRGPVNALAAAAEDLRDRDGQLSGKIRLSAPISFSQRTLCEPLIAFMQQWPDVEIDVQLTDRHVDLIADAIDLAVRLGNLPDSSLRARTIGSIRRPIVASPDYVAAKGTPSTPDDLADHDAIVLTQVPDPERWVLHGDEGEIQTVGIRRRFAVDNGDLAREVALAGLGIVVLPEFFVHEDLREGRLIELLLPWHMQPLGLHLVTPPSRLRARRVDALIRHLTVALSHAQWLE